MGDALRLELLQRGCNVQETPNMKKPHYTLAVVIWGGGGVPVAALALPNHSCSVMRDALASKVILLLALVVVPSKITSGVLSVHAFMTIDSLILFICCYFFACPLRPSSLDHVAGRGEGGGG
jgi:hypothetical protein